MTDREKLLKILSDLFIPVIEAKGFSRHQIHKEKNFPFGDFRREGASGFEVIEIQFDKNGGARFVINFGIIPKVGFEDSHGQHFSPGEIIISWLPEWYRIYPNRFFKTWFSSSVISGLSLTTEPVLKVVQLIPEIEEWFRTSKIGPHVKRAGYPISVKSQT